MPTGEVVDPRTIGPGDVLVLRALGLGDALTGVPALRGLKRRWANQRIIIATAPQLGCWLAGNGLVDGVLPTEGLSSLPDLRGGHVAVNLHGRGPESHSLLLAGSPRALIAFASSKHGHDGPAWNEAEHETDRWCRLVQHAGGSCGRQDLRLRPPDTGEGEGLVILHPGAASPSRRWPVGRWRGLAAALRRSGRHVVITGSTDEAPLAAAIIAGAPGVLDRTGATTLPELAELVCRATLIVCGDTGIAHLATAYGVRSVLLFGPVPPSRWGPVIDADRHTVLWHGSELGPGDPHGRALDPALEQITLAEVLDAVGDQLSAAVGEVTAAELTERSCRSGRA